MTNADLIKILRRPGKAYMPVIMREDVAMIAVEKAFVIGLLSDQDRNAKAEWKVTFQDNSSVYLDVA